MSFRIEISEELRDYIERLHYEKVRYEDLLKTVYRNICPMTDEEWNSSLEYFTNLRDEAYAAYDAMCEFVNEEFADILKGKNWFIDFKERVILPIDQKDNISRRVRFGQRAHEQYNDQLVRMYPSDEAGHEGKTLEFNGYGCKDISFQVTDACNMACTYCYQHHKGEHRMPFKVAKEFIDHLLAADEMVNQYLDTNKCCGLIFGFIGGEPWLEVDLITQISDYVIGEMFRLKHPLAIRFMLSVCTNGLLHFDPRVQKFIKRHMGHLSYNISIDGDRELHDSCRVDKAGNGTYDRAIAGVYQFRDELGGIMGSKMTISPGNVAHVGRAVKKMIESGYEHINLNCVYEEGWTNEHANILYWQLHELVDYIFEKGLQDVVSLSILNDKAGVPLDEDDNKNWCGGLGLMLAIDYKGDMYPCIRYMESSVGFDNSALIVGNLKDGLNNTPEHRNCVDCMTCITRRSQSTDECWNCPIAAGCGWCSAYNWECFGTQNKRATFICCMHKARSLAIYYYGRRMGEDVTLYCPREWAIEIIGEDEYDRLAAM